MKELEKKIKLLEAENERLKSELKNKKTEDVINESEYKFRSIFNNKQTTMLIINPETGDILDANPAACNYYQYSHDEITKLKITNINVSNS